MREGDDYSSPPPRRKGVMERQGDVCQSSCVASCFTEGDEYLTLQPKTVKEWVKQERKAK